MNLKTFFRRRSTEFIYLFNIWKRNWVYSNGKEEKRSFISIHENVEEKDVEKYAKGNKEDWFYEGTRSSKDVSHSKWHACRMYCQAESIM